MSKEDCLKKVLLAVVRSYSVEVDYIAIVLQLHIRLCMTLLELLVKIV